MISGLITKYQNSHKIIAYSGGVDSHVLLHQLHMAGYQHLKAIHINHGLHQAANQWAQHCEQVCHQLGIDFVSIRVTIKKKPRHSLEALAREARYKALASEVSADSVLLTGHNQNDQAETVLLQLMRGAGVRGLSGMPQEKPFAEGVLLRPLLHSTREEIVAYAQQHGLQWIEDPSNATHAFDRNFLRNEVIPALVTRRDGVIQNIARSAEHMADTAELTEALAVIDYEMVKGSHETSLSIIALKRLSDSRQRNVIRYWLSLLPIRLPSQAVLGQIQQQLLYSYPGSQPRVQFGGTVLTRDRIRQEITCKLGNGV